MLSSLRESDMALYDFGWHHLLGCSCRYCCPEGVGGCWSATDEQARADASIVAASRQRPIAPQIVAAAIEQDAKLLTSRSTRPTSIVGDSQTRASTNARYLLGRLPHLAGHRRQPELLQHAELVDHRPVLLGFASLDAHQVHLAPAGVLARRLHAHEVAAHGP
jgi:hypothetical protein